MMVYCMRFKASVLLFRSDDIENDGIFILGLILCKVMTFQEVFSVGIETVVEFLNK